jgi:hypothetical protein
MRISRELQWFVVLTLSLFGAVTAGGEEWVVYLEPEGVPPVGTVTNNEMFFLDESIAFTMGIFVVEEGGENAVVPNRWWESTTLEIEDLLTGERSELDSSMLSVDVTRRSRKFRERPVDEPLSMVVGDRDLIGLTLDLPVGDYDVTVVLRSGDRVLDRSRRTILVREGNESLDVRRTWLMHKSWAKPFEEAKPYLLELALMMKPDQWGYWKSLGDLSIGHAPVEETLDYYDRAERAIRERMKTDGETEFLKNSLNQATIYRRILPMLNQHEGRLGILIRGNAPRAQQEYHWFDREREQKLGRVDLNSPRFEGFDRNTLK